MSAIFDAAVRMFHRAPGGVAGFAPRIGKNPTTLAHEVARDGSAKLGLDTAFEASVMLGDTAIVDAWAQAQGGVFVPVGYAGGCKDAMAAMADCVREAADVCQALSAAMADGVVSANELARVEAEADQLVQAAHRVRALARANHESQAARRAAMAHPAANEGQAGLRVVGGA